MHVQAQIQQAQHANWGPAHCAKADAPAAVFQRVERDGTVVRFILKQRPALTALLHGLEDLGWPPYVGGSDSRSVLNVTLWHSVALMWCHVTHVLKQPEMYGTHLA